MRSHLNPPPTRQPPQLHEVPVGQLASMKAVRQVHSYADELARTAAEAQEGHPTAVADIGDPGELPAVQERPARYSPQRLLCHRR
jgi:hypothetical protein